MVKLDPSLSEVGVLLEPTTIVAKAWEQVYRIGTRAFFDPKVAVITGAGPVGLLAAMIGVQHGLEVHVFDRVTDGPKPKLVKDLGAVYHHDTLTEAKVVADIVLECTGVPSVVLEAMTRGARDSICCLTGVSTPGAKIPMDLGDIGRHAVLFNDVIFGSVNANLRHYQAASAALLAADQQWLAGLISRRVPMAKFDDALKRADTDVKVVLEIGPG